MGFAVKPLKLGIPYAGRWLGAFSMVLGLALGPGFGVVAAVPVEESAPDVSVERSPPQPIPVAAAGVEAFPGAQSEAAQPGPAPSTGVGPLFHQLQVLQGELQTLRGMVEELRFQVERLAQDQQSQYVDLDQRLMALRDDPQPGVGDAGAGTLAPGRQAPTPSVPDGNGESEQQAYTAAFNLMRDRAFDESAAAFERMIETYPNGQFTPNGYYWLGELHLAQGQTEMARQNFAQVVNLYASHTKVPDALYKLGVVHHRLGDNQRALEYLDRVQAESPDSSAAGLARTYAAELR
ncbi:MAG: tol-pal system protein YbgF [Gammaproteobacteria bacterium]|nr:tol-pal system protein YbgF [Gammaproteobacteria bacterium]